MRAGRWIAGMTFAALLLGGCVSQSRYLELQKKYVDRGETLARANAMMDEYQEKVEYLNFEIKAKETLLKKREEELALVSRIGTRINEQMKSSLANQLLAFRPEDGVSVDKKTGALVLEGSVFFDSGSADLKSSAKKTLRKVAEILKSRGAPVQIVGHSDSDPIIKTRNKWPQGNLQLSGARAMNVLVCLRDEGGVPAELLSFAGYGPHKPRVPNDTDLHKRQNRRVEILVSKITE